MNLNIKATGIELTDAINDYVYKKIGSIERFIKSPDTNVQVEVGKTTNHHKNGAIFKAEAHIRGAGIDIYAMKEAEDLYAAIDMLENELKRDLSHWKGRNSRLLRDGQKTIKNMMKGFPWMSKKKL